MSSFSSDAKSLGAPLTPSPSSSSRSASLSPPAASSLPEVNLLLIGEAGTGKRTTLNALVNYIKYRRLDAADAGQLFQMAPAKPQSPLPLLLSIFDYPPAPNSGDSNDAAAAESVPDEPEKPASYVFRYGGRLIRLIDTPSFGQPGGTLGQGPPLDVDTLLQTLRPYGALHGIVILLSASQPLLSPSFRYYFTQLLTTLHSDALSNLAFLITNSRLVNFAHENTFYHLKQFFVQLDLHPDLIDTLPFYNIDNEAYQYLVDKRRNPAETADPPSLGRYRESWKKSAEAIEDLLDDVMSNEAHPLTATLAISKLRNTLVCLYSVDSQLKEELTVFAADLLQLNADVRQTFTTVEPLYDILSFGRLRRSEDEYLYCQSVTCFQRDDDGVPAPCKPENTDAFIARPIEYGHPLDVFQYYFALSQADNVFTCDDCGCPKEAHLFIRRPRAINYPVQKRLLSAKAEMMDRTRNCMAIAAVVQMERLPEKRFIEKMLQRFTLLLQGNVYRVFNPITDQTLVTFPYGARLFHINTVLHRLQQMVNFDPPSRRPALRLKDIEPLVEQLLGQRHAGPLLARLLPQQAAQVVLEPMEDITPQPVVFSLKRKL